MEFKSFTLVPTLPQYREISLSTDTEIERLADGGEFREIRGSKATSKIKYRYNVPFENSFETRQFLRKYKKELVCLPDFNNSERIKNGQVRHNPLFNTTRIYNLSHDSILNSHEEAAEGDIVCPLRLGRIISMGEIKQNKTLEIELTFEEVNSSIRDDWEPQPTYPQIKGRNFVYFLGLTTVKTNDFDEIKRLSHGEINTLEKQEFKPRTLQISDALPKEELDDFLSLFIWNHGRGKSFYTITSQDEIQFLQVFDPFRIRIKEDIFKADDIILREGITHLCIREDKNYEIVEIAGLDAASEGTDIILKNKIEKNYTCAQISFVILVRFSSNDLKIRVQNDVLKLRANLIQLKENDAFTPTYHLIEFENLTEKRRINDYGRMVTYDGEEFLNGNVSIADLTHSSNQLNQTLNLKIIDDNSDFDFNNSEVTVYRSNGNDTSPVYNGFITDYKREKKYTELKCSTFKNFSQASVPTFHLQPLCPHSLGGEGCGRENVSQFFSSAKILSIEGENVMLDNAPPALSRGYLYKEAKPHLILSSDGATVVVTDGAGLDTGDSVEIRPFCDKRASTCNDTFNNLDNFGGFPNIPPINPQLKAMSIDPTAGQTAGKK